MREPVRTTSRRFVSLAALAVALAGCAVGPDYRPPATTLDPSFVNAGTAATNTQAPVADIATFWRTFNDPALTGLVERALAANGDVKIAQYRLQEARAILLGADAERLPSFGVQGSAGRALLPEYQSPGTTRSERTGSVFAANFTADWELDFFGRNLRASESAAAQVDASEAAVHAAQTSIAAEVARNFLTLRGLQQRLDVAEASLDNQRASLRITESRLEFGRGTQLDVARARTLLDSTEATLPALQTAIDAAAYRLATLTAQAPRVVATDLAARRALPNLPVTDLGALPLGTPEQLLRRRPDIVRAERQLAAANADVGVATADLFPRISLSGLLGFASGRLSNLGDNSSQQYSFGAALTWPLLDFGRVRSRIAASDARAQQALATYEQTVAISLEETEGALSQFTRSAQQARSLSSAAGYADSATRLAQLRFDAGAVDFLVVLDAQRQALTARDALVQAQVAQTTSLVSVYRALGGGWAASSMP